MIEKVSHECRFMHGGGQQRILVGGWDKGHGMRDTGLDKGHGRDGTRDTGCGTRDWTKDMGGGHGT